MDRKKKSFKKGDTILIDKPFAHALRSTFKNERCDYCFSLTSLYRCSGCQYVLYCNRTCQKLSWTEHKRECARMKKIFPKILPDAARIMSKIIIKLKNGGSTEKGYYTSNRYRTFKDLMTHYPNLKNDTNRLEHFSTLYEVLKEYMGEAYLPNSVELLGIYGRMCINAFNILDNNLNTIGTGIYLAASVLNHSCAPNATATFDGITLRIGAIKEIEHTDPELHVYISYLELMQTTKERQSELQKNYYFLCECERCSTNYEQNFVNSMICSNTKCQSSISMKNRQDEIYDSVNCSKCLEKISAEKVKLFFDVTDFTEFQLNRMKDVGFLDVCKICLEKQNGIFHPHNINHVKILDLAFESAIIMEQWKESLKYGVLLVEGYRLYYGECHPSLGILYMKLFKLCCIVENVETAVKYLKIGMSILKITHGEDHSLYKNEVIPYYKEHIRWFKRNKGFDKIDDLDLSACFDSFNKHWQQTFEIIDRFQTTKGVIKYDDIVAVINHLNQLIKLLLLDVQSAKSSNQSPCLEYFLNNQLLIKLYSWSLKTDRYKNYLKLEQLKVYEVLLSEFRGHQLLSDDSILNPLLLILNSYDGDCLSVEIEKHLVTVLRHFCVVLSHHQSILSNILKENTKNSKCIILSLLMAFIHRDGTIGEEARDALLIFMSLSRQNDILANILTSKSNVSPVLATGLSGLYSLLPRKLDFENDCYRLSPENIEDVPDLNNFLASVELCNAVAKICHKTVYDQLLDYLYHGFLLPVVGPALMQMAEEEVATATVYLDLLLRSVTHPGLLQTFLKFVLCEKFEKVKIIELLVNRINNRSFKVCITTLALMETILNLNCEDVMLELVFKYLVPCTHIMFSQRLRIKQVDSYCNSADIFLTLIPDIFKHKIINTQTLFYDYRCYLNNARIKISECAMETKHWTYLYDGENPSHTIVEIKLNEIENDQNSILSIDDNSSGYESFKTMKDIDKMMGTDDKPTEEILSNTSSPCESDSPTCFIRQSAFKIKEPFTQYPSLGPFLEALFSKLENMLEQDFRINLRLTAIFTRLAIYNKPLIQSLLLNNTIIFQPCIRSLFQILRSLKQTIETKLSKNMEIIKEAESFLIERENKFSKTQNNRPSSGNNSDSFARGDIKRSSISVTFGAMFRRNSSKKEATLESTSNGYRYYKKNETEFLNLAINAIILTEWLKELAAISQEHSIS